MTTVHDALSYARRGWPVLPVRPNEKRPLIRTGPAHQAATTDVGTISDWWRRFPGARVGLRTGVAFDVIDLDNEAAGVLCNFMALEPGGPIARTRRGYHLYVAARPEHPARNRCRLAAAGIDLRGLGSFVVAPQSGTPYRWVPGRGPDESIPDDHPILDYLDGETGSTRSAGLARPAVSQSSRYGMAAVERWYREVCDSREGTRNDTLNRAAFSLGGLVAGGEVAECDAIDLLTVAGSKAGLGEAETSATIKSGLTAGTRYPKSAPTRRNTNV